jgi:hypothetical protein
VNSVVNGQVTNIIKAQTMRNAPDEHAPFAILPATFLTKKIGQSKPYPGEDENEITVTIKSNVAIASAGSTVATLTISGLTSSDTKDDSSLAITNVGSNSVTNIIGSTGEWNQKSGTLELKVLADRSFAANTEYKFMFKIDNPVAAQASPAVSIEVGGGQSIAKAAMKKDKDGCIVNVGDKEPLFIYPRTFLTKDIGYKTSIRQGENLVSITLASSVALTSISGSITEITVSGLVGMATPDNSALTITSSNRQTFGSTAEWNKERGELVFKIITGETLSASSEVQLDVPITNGVNTVAPVPKIKCTSVTTVIEEETMTYGGKDVSSRFELSTRTAGANVGMTIKFTPNRAIAKGDTLVVTLPNFGGETTDSGDHIWGVTSTPDAFGVEASEEKYKDAQAAGDDVAQAIYRVGFAGRTPAAADTADGELGSTIKLDSDDLDVYGTDNDKAGMSLKIDGSEGIHSIFRQTAAAAGTPAVASFYPKHKYTSGSATAVAGGTKYVVYSQLELTAKDDVCDGVEITITIPASTSGAKVPSDGQIGDITLSHIRAGTASAFTIGTLDEVSSSSEYYSGVSGRGITGTLATADTADYFGYQLAPTRVAPTEVVYVDGFRTVVGMSSSTASLFTGYGPKKVTKLENETVIANTTLNQKKSIDGTSTGNIYLTFSSLSTAKPAIVQGSYFQVGTEMFRATSKSGNGISAMGDPGTPGANCRINGQLCETSDSCVSLAITGCADAPTVTVNMSLGVVTNLIVDYPGVCLSSPENQAPAASSAGFVLASGVTCDTNPACGGGCAITEDSTVNSVEAERAQFGTTKISRTCTGSSACTDEATSNKYVIEDGGVKRLLYTTSEAELGYAKNQHVKVGYMETVRTAAAGKHVVQIGAPAVAGACTKNGQTCTSALDCLTVTFSSSECAVLPTATITYSGTGGVAGFTSPSQGFANSVCWSTGGSFTATFTPNTGVTCATLPSCGTSGCQPTLDTTKDVLIGYHEDITTSIEFTNLDNMTEVVRVHKDRSDTQYKIQLVPPTLLTEKQEGCPASAIELPMGATHSSSKLGCAACFVDTMMGEYKICYDPEEDVDVSTVIDLVKNADGSAIVYPEECKKACNIKDDNGFLIASKKYSYTFDPNGVDVEITIPIIFNTDAEATAAILSGRRRLLAAPAGYEYRINGTCNCPASEDEKTAKCIVDESRDYQVVLMPVSVCSPTTTPKPDDNTAAIVGGIVGGILGACLLGGLLYLCTRKPPPQPEEPKGDEGPVYVGRPVPLTPEMVPVIAAASPRLLASSPIMAPDGFNYSNSYMQPLPTALTPTGVAPALVQREMPQSPGLSISVQPPPMHTPNAYLPMMSPIVPSAQRPMAQPMVQQPTQPLEQTGDNATEAPTTPSQPLLGGQQAQSGPRVPYGV